MVTTTMRMLNGVHSHTSNNRPAVALRLVFVVGATSFQDGLIDTSTTSNNSNHGAVAGRDYFLGAGWQLDTGPLGFRIVSNDGGVVTRCTGKSTTITMLLLNVADDGTFRHGSNGEDVSNLKSGFLSTVDELASVHSFDSQEVFFSCLVTVRVTEVNYSQWSTSAGIVDDFLDDTLDVAMSFGEIFGAEFGGSFAMFSVSLEDSSCSFTLGTNNTTHSGKL